MPAPVPVPCRWPGGTILCVAPGPSLTADDLAIARTVDVPILVVNDAIFHAPQATILFAADLRWWQWHAQDVADFQGWKYCTQRNVVTVDSTVGVLQYRRQASGLSADPSLVYTGGHGGFQAFNLAAHLVGDGGTIVLLGYDMQPGVAPDGSGTVWHHAGGREHPNRSHPRYTRWLGAYTAAYHACRARGMTVINATRATAITVFPRLPLAQAFTDGRCLRP